MASQTGKTVYRDGHHRRKTITITAASLRWPVGRRDIRHFRKHGRGPKITRQRYTNDVNTSRHRETLTTKSTAFDKWSKKMENLWTATIRVWGNSRRRANSLTRTKRSRNTSSLVVLQIPWLRRRALREKPDLASLLKLGRALELSESQASKVEKNEWTINAIDDQHKRIPKVTT